MQRTCVVRTMSGESSAENLPVVEGVLVKEGNEPSNDVSNGEGDFELPRIEDRDGPAALVSTEVEAHTVVSALVLACSVGCDALSAKDVPIDAVD